MKVKNIMFAGFAAAIFASTAHAAATYTLASKDYVDTVKAGYVEANNLMQQQITGIDAAYKAADADLEAAYTAADTALEQAYTAADTATLNSAKAYADGIVSGDQGIGKQVQQNTADIATINASDVMNSGIKAADVTQITTNKNDIATINASAVMTSGIDAAGVAKITTNAQNIQYLTEKTAAYVGPQTEGDYIIRYGKDGNVESLVQITVVDKDGKVMYPVATTPAN